MPAHDATAFIPEVTCFHDAAFPICNIEIKAMNKPDKGGDINWVDITQDKGMLVKAGLANRQAMDRMYVIYENQQIQSGVLWFFQVW